jgi:hypothetical protein
MNPLGDKIIGGLKGNPVVLAVVIINVLFLGYVVREVSASGARRDALIAELARDCSAAMPAQKGDRVR